MRGKIPVMEEPPRYFEYAFAQPDLVEVKDMEGIVVQMQYPLLNMKNAFDRCLLQREVLERLKRARENLPRGLHFVIWDAWRPFALQEELFRVYSEELVGEMHLEGLPLQEQQNIVLRYVCEPIEDRDCPPVHTTGGAIDLTLADETGRLLDMGTGFDSFSPATHTAYFEEHTENKTVRDNRRILYGAMTEAGFTNYATEWWHFDYGDRFWAYYGRRPALYRGIFTKEEAEGYVRGYEGRRK